MSLWNVTGALQSPYSILRNSYTPILPTVKAVYCWESLAILTCEKPDFKSIVEKKRAPTMDSMVSCIRGRGYASFLVRLFSWQKLMQNLRLPIFFSHKDYRVAPGGLRGAYRAPISWMCSLTSSTSGGAIHRNLSLKGLVSNNSITCSAISVHPISFCSNEKIL